MQFTQESKSQLAKLLASENITVEHKKVQTAMFDLKNRVLTCPIWKEMSGDLYDLLMGHEVGHALETPAEGWHNAVSSQDKKISRNFRAFLNVVEDARIEKKMKRKFPGLRQPMIRGYNELIEKDFFGIKGRDINSLPFIDRLNLYTKGGVNLGINFSTDEYSFIKEVEMCETWDDVVSVTKAIFDYSKQEQQEMSDAMKQMAMSLASDTDGDDSEDGSSFDDTDNYDTGGEGDEIGDFADSDDFDGDKNDSKYDSSDADADEFDDDADMGNRLERYKQSYNSTGPQEPVCQTDDAFRSNEMLLLDEKSFDYNYLEVPTPIYKEILTDYKIVHANMEKEWSDLYPEFQTIRTDAFNDFKRKNDRYISLLAKEFEMRKAASKFAKAKISESGDIDVSRIYKYKMDDDIFRKMTKVPKGKSHGLVLLFDRSGSMSGNMGPTIEQIMVLTMFCRKVNIPFVVYGFGNASEVFAIDHGRKQMSSFVKGEPNTILGSDVCLREYLNSDMKNSVFTNAMKNLSLLATAYSRSYNSYGIRKVYVPYTESLSNTPLNEALFALASLTNQFRKKYHLDIVNTLLLHDGDADTPWGMNDSQGVSRSVSWKNSHNVLRDTKNKIEIRIKLGSSGEVQSSVMNWYRKATNSKLIGFFLTQPGRYAKNAIRSRYVDQKGVAIYDMFPLTTGWDRYENSSKREAFADVLTKQLKVDRFLESYNDGYNKFFIIPGGDDLSVENESLQIDGKVTAGKLKNAFMKMNKKKQVSRVLVNRFIGEIAV